MAKHNDLGKAGEMVAKEFLEGKGFIVVDVNWSRPYGELDIIALDKGGAYRFVEVKTVSWETPPTGVSHETPNPEENVHREKAKRLMRTIQAYLSYKNIENDWQFDVIAVFLDQKNKKARVRYSEDIILGG